MFTHWSMARWAVAAVVAALATRGGAEEGMWLYNAPPLERLAHEHGATPTPEWLLHLQRSSVRFSSGGSGAFVSADGLVITNHHVASGCLQKLSSPTRDLFHDGFAAATRDDEIACHDLELNVLVSIEDVTDRVKRAVPPDLPPVEAFAARRAVMATIEAESLAATGHRSDVVTLYQGGLFHLYRSKKYTDVRLVFAPEQQIAFFGGDADNFEFPRFNLDVCFLRAYENGAPARVDHHLTWARSPIGEGDLVFVSGHPGHTDRGDTIAELRSLRDLWLPLDLEHLNRLEALFGAYASEGPEERRQASADLFGVQNGRKARQGILAGLLDPRIVAARQTAESQARARLERALDSEPSPYLRIEEAQEAIDAVARRYRVLEAATGFNSAYFANARTILRAVEERAKPDGERLREYRDSNRASLELRLFSPEPLYDALETAKLADSLTHLAAVLGADDPLVVAVLDGQPPRARAASLVAGTRLGRRAGGAAHDDRRRALVASGIEAVRSSDDPMLALARLIDDEARAVRATVDAANEVKQQAHGDIARERFAREGAASYPDATFTLRLAYGTVRGIGVAGEPGHVSAFTTYAGLFARASAKRETPPFDLPPRWRELRPKLEADGAFLRTPFNFISTADIIGGNSGSPVVNRAGELVGVIFDGNIDSLILDVAYDDTRARAVAVDAGGIVAALERVYGADALVAELCGSHEPPRIP
jgi:hypothetical protein